MLAELRDALEAGEAPRLSRTAHKLVGSLGNFYAPSLATARELERTTAGGNLAGAVGLVAELERAVPRLLAELGRAGSSV
jgi:HPt (histidine-containing phosphotransfer) domain-containing protein